MFAVLVGLLAGCADRGLEAEQRFAMVQKNGSPEEICAAMRKVADTYLELRDEAKFDEWQLKAGNYCLNETLKSQLRSLDS